MKIIHRYIWQEYFVQFLLCFFGFTVLGVGKIIFDYNDFFIGYRVTAGLMTMLVLDQVPTLWMDVLPAASLFGIILSMGRFLRERELDVIRLGGASLIKIMLPIIIGVFLICFGAYWWNDMVVPSANNRFQREIRKLTVQEDMPLLKENVVFKGPENRFIYLQKVLHKQGRIEGVMIIETGKNGKWPRMITAETGKIQRGIWVLENGIIHEFDQKGALISELYYKKTEIKMSNDFKTFIGDEKTPAEMRGSELLERVKLYKRSGMNMPIYAVYYHSKFADPIIALVLVLVAIPLTVLTGRNSRWLGLVYCFLIIMGYYAMQVVGRTMGSNTLIAPWLAAWAPHVLFLFIGFTLLFEVEKRR